MLEGMVPKVGLCRVSKIMAELDDSDKAILSAAIKDRQSWPANTLSTALRERGTVLSDGVITKHRNQLCLCGGK